MPAAEPAPTGDDVSGPPGAGDARIIHLAPHRTHGRNGAAAAHRHRGGAADMPQPAPAPTPDDGEEAILRPLAEDLEKSFEERHMTLADPRVKAVFDLTLDIATHLIRGAAVQGILDEEQRIELARLFEGARRAAALAGE